jgi:[methyl-Co(III) methanol-specific corrinoid protein]:coenzyme M methyltransferase
MNSRERVLKLFAREPIDYIPVFSGYGNITVHGLEKYGWRFAEIHTNAEKMAKMAATTYELFGFECAVCPFDMGVEAEVLGSEVNFYAHRDDVVYPTIVKHAAEKVIDLNIQVPQDLKNAGRIPIVREALSILKERVGNNVAIGSWVLGPYTLAGQLVDLSDLSKSAIKKPELMNEILRKLADYLLEVIKLYREAGADYVTIREMGAGPDILSPRVFNSLIKPHLQHMFATIESPKILHMCGDTNVIVELLGDCGAEVLSVEDKNDVIATRKLLGPDTLIFGEIDAYGVLVAGKPKDVDEAVKKAIDSGVDAVWPGCDIWPTAPKANMKALLEATRKYGKLS